MVLFLFSLVSTLMFLSDLSSSLIKSNWIILVLFGKTVIASNDPEVIICFLLLYTS